MLLAVGCRGRSDLVEAELRLRDRQLRETQAELNRAASLNDAFENSLRAGAPPGCARPPAGGACQALKKIEVGRGTGGIDEDGCNGDEGILVVIVPRDVDDSAVKVGGFARITAFQITPEGLKLPLSVWEVSSGHLRRNWRTGLLSTGYFVSLPWQVIPSFDRLRVVVTFTATDGAVYEAERDIQVRLGTARGPTCAPPRPPVTTEQSLPPSTSPLPLPTPAPGPLSVLPPPVPAEPASGQGPIVWQPSESRKPSVRLEPPSSRP